jgi:hypothetical protein
MLCLGLVHFFVEVSEVLRATKNETVLQDDAFLGDV